MPSVNGRKPLRTGSPKKRMTRKHAALKNKGAIKGVPYFALLGALLIVGFISYFVFWVEKPSTTQVVSQPAYQEEKKEVLPEKPQPVWEYEKTLKTKEIDVDIPEKVLETRDYQMQCASFRNKNDAESLKAKIAFQGLNSQVKKTGNWYRVILGPYERKRPAERDRHKLQRASINGCQIWFWR